MKKNFKYLLMAVIVAAGFTSCDNETVGDNPGGERGKETTAKLRLIEAPGTYGTDQEQTASSAESTIASSVDIYIFDDSGVCEYAYEAHPVNPATGLADEIKVTEGQKYFYVFSNKPSSVQKPEVNVTSREAFEKSVITATIASNNTSITQDNSFLIGTLWRKVTTVTGEENQNISIEIGRAGAKIALTSVDTKIVGELLKGNFVLNTAIYRVCAVPTEFYLVGQYSGTIAPPADGAVVTSAVHDENATASGSLTDDNWNPKFKNYTFESSTNIGGNNQKSYYAIENTSKKFDNYLRYGNTTFLQLQIKYQPKQGNGGEVHDKDGNPNASLTQGETFYAAKVNGQTVIFNESPNGNLAGLDTQSIRRYENGINYYRIVVKDNSERAGGNEQSMKVLRNHYYEVAVNSFSKLGDEDEEVKPWWPIIGEETEVDVTVKVINWSKITQIEDL